MTTEVERCPECGAAATNPHRLRCPRYYDEQERERAFDESGGAQFAMIGGVVVGGIVMVLLFAISLAVNIQFNFALLAAVAGGSGWAVHNWLRGIAERNAGRK